MHITLETDYAIRIVLCLAKERRRMDAKNISAETEVTLRFALKILRKLVASGLVRSFKGIKGGYEIARPANEINLYEIIQVVEGDCFFSRCLNEDVGCNRNATKCCKVRKAFAKVSKTVQQELSMVTIDTLL
jgi:Rrf2 family protein